MKYFFLVEKNGDRNIIAAQSEQNARDLAVKSNLTVDSVYELTEDTFSDEGFLFSDDGVNVVQDDEPEILSDAYVKLVVAKAETGAELVVIESGDDTPVRIYGAGLTVKLTPRYD